jgi:hypothetical protein
MVFVSGRKRIGPRPGHNMRKQGFNAGVKVVTFLLLKKDDWRGKQLERVATIAGGT